MVLLTAFFVAYLGYKELGIEGFRGIVIGFSLALFNFLIATLFGLWGIKKQTIGSLTTAILSGILVRFPIILGVLFYVSKLKSVNFLVCVVSFTVIFTVLLIAEIRVLSLFARLNET